MHDLAIVENILKIIKKEATKNKLKKVTKVRLKLGKLADHDPAHMTATFNAISEGTIASGAKLEIERTPGKELYVENLAGES